MDIQQKTNEELIKELQALQQEYNSLKELLDQGNLICNNSDDAMRETNMKLTLAMKGGNMAWWEMDVLTGKVAFDKHKVEMLGFAPENFNHYTDFTSLVHPKDYKRIMKAMKGHLDGLLDKYEAEYRIMTRSGEYIWFYDYGSVVKKDSNGTPLICTGFVYNITERKQAGERLRKSQELLQTVLDNFPGAVFWKDKQSIFLGCNQSLATSAGLNSPVEIVGKTDHDLPWHSTEAKKYRQDDLEVIKSGKPSLHIGEMLHQSNGKVLNLDTCKFPLLDSLGKVIGMIGVSNDISTLRTVEQELLQTNKELLLQNEEKEKRAEELIIAKEKAEASDRLKTAFMNNISHEIRTPLNSILGFAPFIIQPDITIEEKVEYLEILNLSSIRLMDTITGIMDISLIISGNMEVHLQPIEIFSLLTNVFKHFQEPSKKKNLELKLQFPDSADQFILITDGEMLRKAVSKLVDNSIKFTKEGSVTLGFELINKEIEIFVKDTGKGIDKNVQDLVFKPFMQEDVSVTRGHEGNGLGLSIAKGIIQLLGGEIRLESTKNLGTTVFLTLPHT